jgi:hypothetical protein
MDTERFQQVYETVCKSLGTQPCTLEPDASGQVGFGLTLGQVQVHVAATRWVSPGEELPTDGLLLLVEFGAADPLNECDILGELLDANLLLAAAGGPVFSRNPVDGKLLLQQVFPLATITGERVQATAQQLALMAQAWRDGRLTAQGDTSAADNGCASPVPKPPCGAVPGPAPGQLPSSAYA